MRKQLILGILMCAFSTACSVVKKPADGPPPPVKLDDAAAYKAIYESDIPVLIEFCSEVPQSKLLTPIVTELAEQHRGLFKVVRMDAEKAPETMQLFEVPTTPSLVFVSKKQCKHGKRLDGVAEKDAVKIFIDQSLIQCRE